MQSQRQPFVPTRGKTEFYSNQSSINPSPKPQQYQKTGYQSRPMKKTQSQVQLGRKLSQPQQHNQQQQKRIQFSDISDFEQNQNETFNQKRNQANQILASGNVQQAFQEYEIAMQEANIGLRSNQAALKSFYGTLIQKQCSIAMKFIEQQNHDKALEILFQAQKFTSSPKYMDFDLDKYILVLNNIGCAYKRMQRFQKAEQYLQLALDTIQDNQCFDSIGLTYLNICAVSSQAGNHDKAFDFAKKALLQCQKQLLEIKSDPIQRENKQLVREKARYTAISYLNLGAEEEYQKNLESSLEHYQKGQDLLQTYTGQNDPLLIKFKNSYAKCKAKLSTGSAQRLSQTRQVRPNSAQNKIGKTQSQQFFKTTDLHSQTPQIGKKQQSQNNFQFTKSGHNSDLEKTQKLGQEKYQNNQAAQLRQTIVQRRKDKYEQSRKKFPLRQNFQSEIEDDQNASELIHKRPQRIIKKKRNQSSLERSREMSQEREMSDLEKMGVLQWSDSENSEAENELMKHKRLNFLQSLNTYSKDSVQNTFQTQQFQSQTFANNFQKPQYQPPKVLTQSEIQNQQQLQSLENKLLEEQKQSNEQQQQEQEQKQSTPRKRKSTEKPKEPEYDEEKIKFIQRRARQKHEHKMALEEGRRIREEQKKKLEEYRREKMLKKQQDELRLKEEEDERVRLEQEEKRRLEEQERLLQQDQELQLLRNDKAQFIQQQFRRMQSTEKVKNKYRAKRKEKLEKKKFEDFKKVATKIQKNFRMIRAMKEYKMIQEVRRNRERFTQLRRYTKGIKEIKMNFFAERKTAPTQYYNAIVGIRNQNAPLDEQKLVWKFTKQKGHEADIEAYSTHSLGFKLSKKELEIPLDLRQHFLAKLQEIHCDKLDLEQKSDVQFLASKLDDYIYLKDDKLYMEDITDLPEEELKYIQDYVDVPLRKKNVTLIKLTDEDENKAALKIQKNFRTYRERTLLKYKTKKQYVPIKNWTITVARDLNTDDFIYLYLFQDSAERKYFGAKNLSYGSRGQKFKGLLEFTVSMQEKFPNPTISELEELLVIEPMNLTLEYSDLAMTINGDKKKEEENKEQTKLDLAIIVKIQARIRQLREQSNFQLIKDLKKKRRDKSKRFLVTRRQIFNEGIPYNLSLYYNPEHKTIEVTCVPIGKHDFSDKIPMYVQSMFDDFAQSNYSSLYFYAPRLLERAYLKKTRKDGEKKLHVPRIEEVMAEIKINIKKALGEEIDFRDSTIEARMIFNSQRLRMIQNQHKSVVTMLENEDQNIKKTDYSRFQDGSNYAQMIQKNYKSFKFQQKYNIKKTKNLKHGQLNKVEIEDLKAYAMSIQTGSLGFKMEKLEHLEAKKKRIKEEGEIVKPEQKGDKIIENLLCPAISRPWMLKFDKIKQEVDEYELQEKLREEEEEKKRIALLQKQGSKDGIVGDDQHRQSTLAMPDEPIHQQRPSSRMLQTQKSSEQVEKERKNQAKYFENQQYLEKNQEKYDAMAEELRIETWDFDIYYNKEHQNVTVVGLRTYGKEDRREVKVININLTVLHFSDSKNPVAVKNKAEDIIIKQLRYEDAFNDPEENKKYGSNIYFEEPIQIVKEVKQEKQLKDLKGAELLAMELAADKSTTVQLQLFNSGQYFLVCYSINLTSNIIMADITYKVDTNIKTQIQFYLAQFDCIHLENMVAFKNTEELLKFFKEILKQITNRFQFTLYKEDKIAVIRHNGHLVAQSLPVILRDVFALKLQTNIKAFRLRKLFSTWLNLMKSQMQASLTESQKEREKDRPILDQIQDKQLFIQSFQKLIPQQGYIQISFFLIRRNFNIKMVLNRHPIRSSQQAKSVYSISLLQLKQQFDLSNRERVKEIQQQRLSLKRQKSQMNKDQLNYAKEGGFNYKNHPDYADPSNITDDQWDEINQSIRPAKFKEDPIYLTQNKWMEIQGIHQPRYYRHLYTDLLHYLVDNINFFFKYDKVNAETIDKRIHLNDEKISKAIQQRIIKAKSHNAGAERKMVGNTHCIMMVQAAFKRFKAMRLKQINRACKDVKDKQLKTIGERVKRAFKKLGDELYIVNIYQRENIFTFHLINALREKKREKKKKEAKIITIKGQYEYDPSKLLNTRDKTIAEYLLDQVELVDVDPKSGELRMFDKNSQGQKEIRFKDEYFKGIASEKIDYIPQDYSKPKFRSQKTIGNIQLDLNAMGEGVPTTIQSNLVDYVHEKDKEGRELLYNVVYTGKKPQPKPGLIDEEDPNQAQTVKIDVDLGELKKLYPNVDPQSQELMKTIGEQLIEGIKIGNEGDIILDNNKLNPHCLNVSNEKLHHDVIDRQQQQLSQRSLHHSQHSLARSQQQQQIQEEEQESENKRILMKNTRFFSKIKYLILIYQVERKVNKIIQQAQDSVFQDYETIYQICALNMTIKSQQPIIWEITPDEISDISKGLTTSSEKAHFIMKRLQIFNNSFIFIVDIREHLQYVKPKDNLVLFYEKGIQPIQIHFRSRHYRKNYNQFKQEIGKRKLLNEVVWKGIPQELKSVKTYYLLACFYKSKAKILEFTAWDMTNYERYEGQVDKENLRWFYLHREETVRVMSKFFDIDIIEKKLIYNKQVAADFMDKYFKEYKEPRTNKAKSKYDMDSMGNTTRRGQFTASGANTRKNKKTTSNIEKITFQDFTQESPTKQKTGPTLIKNLNLNELQK